MSLLHGLVNGKGKLNNNEIVRFYAQWIKSKPFDIGGTCRASLFKSSASKPNPAVVK